MRLKPSMRVTGVSRAPLSHNEWMTRHHFDQQSLVLMGSVVHGPSPQSLKSFPELQLNKPIEVACTLL